MNYWSHIPQVNFIQFGLVSCISKMWEWMFEVTTLAKLHNHFVVGISINRISVMYASRYQCHKVSRVRVLLERNQGGLRLCWTWMKMGLEWKWGLKPMSIWIWVRNGIRMGSPTRSRTQSRMGTGTRVGTQIRLGTPMWVGARTQVRIWTEDDGMNARGGGAKWGRHLQDEWTVVRLFRRQLLNPPHTTMEGV